MNERSERVIDIADMADIAPTVEATRHDLTHRDRAILRAVAGGRAELAGGSQPDLFLDGRCCCDQVAAHRLAHAGLITTAAPATFGQRVPARLTPAGHQELLAG
jgi:hypothetical protein